MYVYLKYKNITNDDNEGLIIIMMVIMVIFMIMMKKMTKKNANLMTFESELTDFSD